MTTAATTTATAANSGRYWYCYRSPAARLHHNVSAVEEAEGFDESSVAHFNFGPCRFALVVRALASRFSFCCFADAVVVVVVVEPRLPFESSLVLKMLLMFFLLLGSQVMSLQRAFAVIGVLLRL